MSEMRSRSVSNQKEYCTKSVHVPILYIIRVIPKNDADMHTKNVLNPLFENFGTVYFGEDEYFVESDTPGRYGVGSENWVLWQILWEFCCVGVETMILFLYI